MMWGAVDVSAPVICIPHGVLWCKERVLFAWTSHVPQRARIRQFSLIGSGKPANMALAPQCRGAMQAALIMAAQRGVDDSEPPTIAIVFPGADRQHAVVFLGAQHGAFAVWGHSVHTTSELLEALRERYHSLVLSQERVFRGAHVPRGPLATALSIGIDTSMCSSPRIECGPSFVQRVR